MSVGAMTWAASVMPASTWAWVIFIGLVLGMLAVDLLVFHRDAHAVGMREALGWSVVWISFGLAFAVPLFFAYERHWFGLGMAVDPVDGLVNDGRMAATKYLTAYVVEKSLSVDNLFVIALVLGSVGVAPRYQHRVLFWGILGALVMRGTMIGAGAVLIARFEWILYLFGVFLAYTGIKMLVAGGDDDDEPHSKLVGWLRRRLPISEQFHGERFLVRGGAPEAAHDPVVAAARPGSWLLTPLAVALVLVELTDLVFAVDSIPAVFAISADPLLVFTSNVFAILGLRSLYFALAAMLSKFSYLKPALALILVLVGGKMLLAKWLHPLLGDSFNLVVLGAILALLAGGVGMSIIAARRAS